MPILDIDREQVAIDLAKGDYLAGKITLEKFELEVWLIITGRASDYTSPFPEPVMEI